MGKDRQLTNHSVRKKEKKEKGSRKRSQAKMIHFINIQK